MSFKLLKQLYELFSHFFSVAFSSSHCKAPLTCQLMRHSPSELVTSSERCHSRRCPSPPPLLLPQAATSPRRRLRWGAINFVPRFAILMNGFFNAMFLARYAAAWAEQEPNWPDAESLVWLLVTAPPCPACPPLPFPYCHCFPFSLL